MSAPRVAIVCPVPMPYTFPVMKLIARSEEVELTVLYGRRSLPGRGHPPDPAAFGFPHTFLADAGRVFVGRDVREVDLNPGLPRVLERLRAELVIVSGFVQPTALLGIAWATLRRKPYGVWVESHDLRPRTGARRILRRPLLGPLVRRAALLLPTGESAADSLAALGGARPRMALFPHVPDPTVFHARGRDEAAAALRLLLGLGAETPLIVFAGRLVESKGVETLLRAHSELYPRTGAQLVIAGTGPLERMLTATRQPGVSFLGFLEPRDLAAVLRGAEIAVSPSLVEPWGTSVLEAAACGCAIVASDVVPSAVELVGRSGAGRLVSPGESSELASALYELLSDPGELAAMSRLAAEAAASYTPEGTAAAFLEVVRRTLAAREG